MSWKWSNIPIPDVHVVWLVVGSGLQLVVPWSTLDRAWIGHAMGWPLVLVGLCVVIWTVATLQDVEINSTGPLVTEGPFARSRNPMYLAWHLLFAGVGLVCNAAWFLVLLPVVIARTHRAILGEELALTRHFGVEYEAYAKRVRRYLPGW